MPDVKGPLIIRRFEAGEEETVSILMRRTLLEVNANYCPASEIDWLYKRYTPETILQIAADAHMYVMTRNGTIIGTGTVTMTGERECEIIAVGILPELLRQGYGSRLLRVMEADAFCQNSDRIWLTSSVNALPFYEAHGYVNPNGYRQRDPVSHFLVMEKRR